jgi:hypothetical protein
MGVAMSDTDLSDAIAEALAGAGVAPTGHLVEALESLVIEWAIQRAAEALHDIGLRLGDTATGHAFRRAVLGDDEEPVRKVAERVGVSHVALVKSAAKIRQRLGGLPSRAYR